jgi:hypothetical protein
VNLLWIGRKYSVNMPSGIVTKPPKPVSSVSAVLAWAFSGFLDRIFLWFAGRGRLYRGAICSGRGHRRCYRAKRGRCPTKSLNDFRQGGGDVWISLESGHQGVELECWGCRFTPLFCRSRAAQSGYSAGPECAAKGYGVILSFQLEPQLSYFRLRLHVMAPGCYFTLSSKM